ncbi:MAG: von Willebrand factor type A domain-containing protein, partial [Ignavibacteriales bacterium]|nr:von Willebrand factor type A domain-containing protein [Ignavibacteriales bacterium]
MNNTHIHDQLDDYVDGQLPPDKHKAFEQHLQSCTMCQQELQMFNALREKISSLPQSIQPERDLWTGIESRLRTPEKPLVEGWLANRRNGKLFSLPSLPLQGIRMSTWYIRAAAIVLLLATASVLWIMLHRSAPEQQIVTRKGTEATSPRITQDTSRQQIFPPPKIVQTPGQPSEYLASRETPHGKKPLGIQPKREQPVAPATPNDSLTLITQLQQNIPPAIGPIGTGKIVGRITDKSTGVPLVGVNVLVVGTTRGSVTDIDGKYTIIGVPPGSYSIRASQVGYTQTETRDVKVAQNENTSLNFSLNTSEVAIMGVTVSAQKPVVNQMSISALQATGRSIEAIPSAKGVQDVLKLQAGIVKQGNNLFLRKGRTNGVQYLVDGIPTYSIQGKPGEKNQQGHNIGLGGEQEFNTEQYDRIYENEFLDALKNPLSTFSIDVDAASYSNIRRFINNGQFPPKDAVRIEEMINYFTYDYPQPKDKHPFSITTEVTTCPWNTSDKLLLIGLQGKKIPLENLPPSNLVFLIDVSGSMNEPNKLPLVKSAFRLLVDQLRDRDRVSIVVYAGSPGLVLPSTSGSEKATIMQAIDNLEAGGSTAGGAGIKLAYKVAKENFKKDGNNRVILATDGDFNVGVSSDGELVRIIEEQRNEGVYLSVLGFGMGNYKDSKMEKLADKGNGN